MTEGLLHNVARALAVGRLRRGTLGGSFTVYPPVTWDWLLDRILLTPETSTEVDLRQELLADAECALLSLAALSVGCPMCHRRAEEDTDPALTFCSKHYRLFLSTTEQDAGDPEAHRTEAVKAILRRGEQVSASEAETSCWEPRG